MIPPRTEPWEMDEVAWVTALGLLLSVGLVVWALRIGDGPSLWGERWYTGAAEIRRVQKELKAYRRAHGTCPPPDYFEPHDMSYALDIECDAESYAITYAYGFDDRTILRVGPDGEHWY